MQEITFNHNFINKMFENVSCNDVLIYSNIFIGTFCLLQLISFSFQAIDYVFDKAKTKESEETEVNNVNGETSQQNQETHDENQEYESESDSDSDSQSENYNERHKLKMFTWDMQSKITSIIQENEDLFTDKRSASRLKYKINKEISEYFAQAYTDYVNNINKYDDECDDNEKDDEVKEIQKELAH
jgi:hypothetical protein